MKATGMICLIGLAISVDFAAGLSKEELLRWKNAIAKVLCESKNEVLLKELIACEDKYLGNIQSIYDACKKEAFEDDESIIKAIVSGCKDAEQNLQKYFDCVSVHYDEEDFRQKIIESTDALQCKLDVFNSHGFGDNDDLVLNDV